MGSGNDHNAFSNPRKHCSNSTFFTAYLPTSHVTISDTSEYSADDYPFGFTIPTPTIIADAREHCTFRSFYTIAISIDVDADQLASSNSCKHCPAVSPMDCVVIPVGVDDSFAFTRSNTRQLYPTNCSRSIVNLLDIAADHETVPFASEHCSNDRSRRTFISSTDSSKHSTDSNSFGVLIAMDVVPDLFIGGSLVVISAIDYVSDYMANADTGEHRSHGAQHAITVTFTTGCVTQANTYKHCSCSKANSSRYQSSSHAMDANTDSCTHVDDSNSGVDCFALSIILFDGTDAGSRSFVSSGHVDTAYHRKTNTDTGGDDDDTSYASASTCRHRSGLHDIRRP
ncbi:hypothetical protein PINS_up015054 [Pythium insidiosum]|nr:hypothetical protein PINS_up015054 [Pythium insidiosum]